jgi:hypothetical protein
MCAQMAYELGVMRAHQAAAGAIAADALQGDAHPLTAMICREAVTRPQSAPLTTRDIAHMQHAFLFLHTDRDMRREAA